MARDAAVALMIAQHTRDVERNRSRARAAQIRKLAELAALATAGIDPAAALIGTAAIAGFLGISGRTVRKWRAENHLGLADIVQQASPRCRLFASRRRLGEVRAALQAEQAARVSPKPRPRAVSATGARALIVAVFRHADQPLTATEIAMRCRGVDVRRSIRPELTRLVGEGALERELGDRTSAKGPRRVWRYSVADPRVLAWRIEKGIRSRAAADRALASRAYAAAHVSAHVEVGMNGPGHGCDEAAGSGRAAPALAMQPAGRGA